MLKLNQRFIDGICKHPEIDYTQEGWQQKLFNRTQMFDMQEFNLFNNYQLSTIAQVIYSNAPPLF